MATAEMTALASLYETDETAWLDMMADLARSGRLEQLDSANLAEFLESMAERHRRQVASRLTILLAHLLKWERQPDRRSRSWRTSMEEQRLSLARLLSGAVLRAHAGKILSEAYDDAVRLAAIETGLPKSAFPSECPFKLEAALADPLEGGFE